MSAMTISLSEANIHCLPREILAIHVGHLDRDGFVGRCDVHSTHQKQVPQPPCERPAHCKLHGRSQDGVVWFEEQVEQAAPEVQMVLPLARSGEQYLNDFSAQVYIL